MRVIRRAYRVSALLRLTRRLLADESVVDGIHGTDVEAASAAETVGRERLAINAAFGGIKGASADAGVAVGAAAAVNLHAKDTQWFKKPTQEAEGADELTKGPVEAERHRECHQDSRTDRDRFYVEVEQVERVNKMVDDESLTPAHDPKKQQQRDDKQHASEGVRYHKRDPALLELPQDRQVVDEFLKRAKRAGPAANQLVPDDGQNRKEGEGPHPPGNRRVQSHHALEDLDRALHRIGRFAKRKTAYRYGQDESSNVRPPWIPRLAFRCGRPVRTTQPDKVNQSEENQRRKNVVLQRRLAVAQEMLDRVVKFFLRDAECLDGLRLGSVQAQAQLTREALTRNIEPWRNLLDVHLDGEIRGQDRRSRFLTKPTNGHDRDCSHYGKDKPDQLPTGQVEEHPQRAPFFITLEPDPIGFVA